MSRPLGPAEGRAATAGRIGIVVVNWNGWQDTLACVASLRALDYEDRHIYVVDNASTDDSVARLQDLGDGITLIRSNTNTGWSGGNNLGLRAALQDGCDCFWLVNNDVTVSHDSLSELVRAAGAHGSEYGFLGCLVEYAEPSDWYQYAGTTVDDEHGLPAKQARLRSELAQPPDLIDVHYVYGCALFVHRRVIDDIGLIDDRYYLNYDETDWCYRGATAGWKSAIVTRASVRHKGSATIGGSESPLNVYFMTRNALLFTRLHARPAQHRRLLLDTLRQMRWDAGKESGAHWTVALLRPGSALLRARMLAVRDYLLRRFGECPAAVRRMAADARRS